MKVIGVLLLLASAMCPVMLAEESSVNMQKCEEDHQCDKGQFCYKAQLCVPCIDCEIYYRLQSAKWTCPKEPQNCGGCLPGYEEELLTGDLLRDSCVPVQYPPQDNSYSLSWYIIIGVSILAASIIVSICICQITRKKEQNLKSCISNYNMQDDIQLTSVEERYFHVQCEVPPSAPLLPERDQCSSARITDVENQLCYNNEKKCCSLLTQAKPVQYPTYPYLECNNNSTEVSPQQDTAESEHVHPSLNDDSTMQCNGSPGPEQVETLASIDEMEETNHEEEKVSKTVTDQEEGVSKTVTNLNNSGVLDNSCQTSNSNITRPFAHVGSSSKSMEDTRGVTRSHSEEDLSTTDTMNKRQRLGDTVSLNEGTASDI